MSKAKFTHLHGHSAFSLRDGVGKVEDIIAKAKEDGHTAIALTEHGNMYSHVDFYFKAKKAGIKPIIGIEAYVVRDRHTHGQADDQGELDKESVRNKKRAWHLILLAENKKGYKNLLKLVSASNRDGYYYNPRMDFELLEKYSDGLICLSGCLGGEVQQAILNDDLDWAEEAIERFIRIFGKDNFFLEAQNHEVEEEEKVRNLLPKLAKKYGIKVVATNDFHYTNKEDKVVQNAIIAIRDRTTLDDPDLKAYPTNHFYVKSAQEMAEMFPDNPEWLQNAYDIGQRCKVELKYDKIIFPEIVKGKAKKEEALRELCRVGWRKLIQPHVKDKDKLVEYGDRVKMELDVILNNGFADYFLLVHDIMRYAREKDIPTGNGRGSVGGSLVALLLEITEQLDPITYELFFERFLNSERLSPPDIDLDFADDRRAEIVEYTREKYGVDCFAKTVTFGNFQPKQALRMAFKCYGFDIAEQDKHAGMIPKVVPGVPNVRFKHLYGEVKEFPGAISPDLIAAREKFPDVFFLAEKLEGIPSHASTHASSYIITDKPVEEYVPLDYDPRSKDVRIGVDMYSADKVKLLKMDYLGIETLSILENAIELANKRHGTSLTRSNIPFDDENTWNLICQGDTIGMFQFESDGMRSLLKKALPRNIEELSDCNAIYRPGAAKFIDDYCAVKMGNKQAHPIHPLMEPVLKVTHGVLIYQEQVMKMCQILAGFSLAEADYMRKAIGKKKEEDMRKLLPMFESGCKKNGINKDVVDEILGWFHDMSRYNFNKAHAVAYSINGYKSAYMKANFPLEFMTAMLNKKTKELNDYLVRVNDGKRRRIKILGPNINESFFKCAISDDKIYFGLNLIKGVNNKTITALIENREKKGKFKSYKDLFARCHGIIEKRTMEGLIEAGALDSVGVDRKWALERLEEQLKLFRKAKKQTEEQISMFEPEEVEFVSKDETLFDVPQRYRGFDTDKILEQEKERLGFYVSGSPLDPYREILDDEEFVSSMALQSMNDEYIRIGGILKDVRKKRDRNGNEMAFGTLEDDYGSAKLVVFASSFDKCKYKLKEGRALDIQGKVSDGSLLVNRIKDLTQSEMMV